MSKSTRRPLSALTIAAALAAPAFAHAKAVDPGAPGPVDATVTIRAHSAAAGIGYTWGDGVLTFRGHRYPFTVKGIDVAAVGYTAVVGHGRVYNLHHLADFSGTYAASTGQVTVGTGIGGQVLINATGVQLRVDDVTRGANLSGSADGIQLTLK